jgi:hypothetical protein
LTGEDSVNFVVMRRALVLADEGARHPFLATLPPHVRAGAKRQPEARKWALTASDARQFAHTYCAGFAAVSLFIA